MIAPLESTKCPVINIKVNLKIIFDQIAYVLLGLFGEANIEQVASL